MIPPMLRDERAKARLVMTLLIAGALLHAVYYLHVIQDDAYISFRYATNLRDHGSLTFNGPGFDRVEGYSNLTWVLLLAAAYTIGISPLAAAKLFGLVSLGAAVAGTVSLTGLLVGKTSVSRFVAAAALGTSACFVSWSVQGLETPFVAALLVWSAVLFLELLAEPDAGAAVRRATHAGVAFGVLGISRPEAPLFGLVAIWFAVAALRTHRAALNRFVAGFAVPVLAQFLFRFAYYGRPLANTVYAKVHGNQLERGLQYLVGFMGAKGVLFVAGYVLVVALSLRRSAKQEQRGPIGPRFVAALLGAYLLFIALAGGDFMRGFRFFMHVAPLAAALGTWAFASMLERAAPARRRSARVAALAVIAVVVLRSNLVTERGYSFGPEGALDETSAGLGFYAIRRVSSDGPHARTGHWLRTNLPPRALVALSEAGIVPFESGLPTIDYLGLNDRKIADLIHDERDRDIAGSVLDRKPAAIVMTGMASGTGKEDVFVGRLPEDLALQRDARFQNYALVTAIPFAPVDRVPFFAFGVFVHDGVLVHPAGPDVVAARSPKAPPAPSDAPAAAAAPDQSLVATPNPVPAGPGFGETTITWRAAAGRDPRVFVSVDGTGESLFAQGSQGTQKASWIQTGHTYDFRLYDGNHQSLATVRVARIP
jgi:arabinofuranosyltransferase